MTHFSLSMNSCARWFLRTVTFLLVCLPGVAQESNVTAPLTSEEVMQRVVASNELRAKALGNYSSIRSYHLECHCLSHKEADMVVRVDYQAPDKKEFTIVSESGSGTVRNKVFKKLLDAEQESLSEENQKRSAISLQNYTFQLSEYQKTDTDEFYVLVAEPRNKNKFLFRGRIWVDAKDFAITRVEGQPAVNPSWWTLKTDFKRRYQKVDDFWLPVSNESETKVRIFGTAVLSISYSDYQITRGREVSIASSQQKPSNGQ
jgi:outer membrane lipoprotein-sorting protein